MRKPIENPAKTHLVLITELYEGGDAESMMAHTAAIKQSGVNLIVLPAISDSGHPAYEAKHAEGIVSHGCPVFACTPDQFPSMTASALTGKDLTSWAAEQDIALIRDLEWSLCGSRFKGLLTLPESESGRLTYSAALQNVAESD